MTAIERRLWWVGILAVMVGFVWLFQSILLPFVAGIAIAYLLDPIADRLEKVGVGRGLAAALTLFAFFFLAVLFLLLLVPIIQSQIGELTERLPAVIAALQNWTLRLITHLQGVLSEEDFEQLRSALTGQVGTGLQMFTDLAKGIFSRGMALFEFFSVLMVTPVVAFYLLRDWDEIVDKVGALIPLEYRTTVKTQLALVDDTLAGFVRGQAIVCVLLGFGYGISLALAGLPFGFTVGLMAGLVSFVPYLGSIFGLVTSVGLAFLEFDELLRIAIIAAIFLIGQVIEGNFLTPKLVGERVRLHPVWVIFALFAGGSLLGFLGMLIALPVAAVMGVLVRFLIDQYRASRLYDKDSEA